MYICHIFSIISWWTSWLILYFYHCELGYNKHRSSGISHVLTSYLCIYSEKWESQAMWLVYFCFFEESLYCFHNGCTNRHYHRKYIMTPFSPHPHQYVVFSLWDKSPAYWNITSLWFLICISLMAFVTEQFLMFVGHSYLSFEKMSTQIL